MEDTMARRKHCGSTINSVMFFDRSNPDDIAYYDPRTGRKPTKLAELTECRDSGKPTIMRADIVLINTDKGQFAVEPTRDGLTGNGVDFLTATEHKRAIELQRRVIETANKYPVWEIYLNHGISTWPTK